MILKSLENFISDLTFNKTKIKNSLYVRSVGVDSEHNFLVYCVKNKDTNIYPTEEIIFKLAMQDIIEVIK